MTEYERGWGDAIEAAASCLVPKPDASMAARILIAFCQGKIRALSNQAPPKSLRDTAEAATKRTIVPDEAWAKRLAEDSVRAGEIETMAPPVCPTCGRRPDLAALRSCPDCAGGGK